MSKAVETMIDGLHYLVSVPDDAPEAMYPYGIVIGPPDAETLSEFLGYPIDLARRLHEEMYHRRLYSLEDALGRRHDVMGALQGTLRLDVDRIIAAYREASNADTSP